MIGTLVVTPLLCDQVIREQGADLGCRKLREEIKRGEQSKDWTVGPDSGVRYHDRLVVPVRMREEVMRDFHSSRLAIHLGDTKLYYAVRQQYW